MSDHEARSRAVYDQHDEPRESGRGRRPVADWGVGEEIFDGMPSRRFSRAERHARGRHGEGRHGDDPRGGAGEGRHGDDPRGGAGEGRHGDDPRRVAADGRPTIVIGERPDDDLAHAPASRREAFERCAAARRLDPLQAAAEWSDAARVGETPGEDEAPAAPSSEEAPAADERAGSARAQPAHATTDGRRTIVIGGRPERGWATAPQRRRPPRTAAERVGARPDRIVAYAVAIGFLLILIAIVSGH